MYHYMYHYKYPGQWYSTPPHHCLIPSAQAPPPLQPPNAFSPPPVLRMTSTSTGLTNILFFHMSSDLKLESHPPTSLTTIALLYGAILNCRGLTGIPAKPIAYAHAHAPGADPTSPLTLPGDRLPSFGFSAVSKLVVSPCHD